MKLEKKIKDKVLVFQLVFQLVILRKKGYVRKFFDGVKQDLFFIVEDKVISDNYYRNLELFISFEDTVKVNIVKEVGVYFKIVVLNLV